MEFLHDQIYRGKIGWKQSLATVTAAVAFLSGSDELLTVLGGAKRKLAMVLIAIMGLVLPLMVRIWLAERNTGTGG